MAAHRLAVFRRVLGRDPLTSSRQTHVPHAQTRDEQPAQVTSPAMAGMETVGSHDTSDALGVEQRPELFLRPRPVARGIRAFLYVATALAFFAGVQLTLLTEQTDRYGFWPIRVPSTAAFMGASYLATCALFLWAARQSEWIRVRAAVSGGVFVTTGLLVPRSTTWTNSMVA
jgi:hypothetical protein